MKSGWLRVVFFFSSCSGRTWEPTNSGIGTRVGPSGDAIPVFCLSVDPHDNNILWIGTQNVRGFLASDLERG
jgi:hypothetical protein